MTERDPAKSAALEERARRLADLLVKAANDPVAERRREIAEEELDRRDALILEAYHAAREPISPVAGSPLGDVAALHGHLQSSGHEVTRYRDDLRIEAEPPVDIHWASERHDVRFVVRLPVEILPDRQAKLDEAIVRCNALTGLPIWRASPALIAAVSAPVAADGSVSSGEVDRALRILKTTVARDEAGFLILAGDPMAVVRGVLVKLGQAERHRFKQRLVERAIRLIAPELPDAEADDGEWGFTRLAVEWLNDPSEERRVRAAVAVEADLWDGGVRNHDYDQVFLGPANIAGMPEAELAARVAFDFEGRLPVHQHHFKPPESASAFAAESAVAFQLTTARRMLANH